MSARQFGLSLLVALLATGCATSLKRHSDTISVRAVRASQDRPAYELRNGTDKPLAYAHWFGLDRRPVAYCRGPEGEPFLCDYRAVVTNTGEPWEHEAYLNPGRSVRFEAQRRDFSAVGVKVWIASQEQYVWSTP
jgi:hypothetical protein